MLLNFSSVKQNVPAVTISFYFSYGQDHTHDPSKLTKKKWKSTCLEVPADIRTEDFDIDFDTHPDFLRCLSTDPGRKTEVNLRNLSPAEQKQFHEAKKVELDSWVKHSVYSLADRTGVPRDRIMTMRLVLTWKVIPGTADKKAKARLVVRGFQDPDLVELRAEAPTLARHSRHLLVQISASSQWALLNGDVQTAFLQGDRVEGNRDVYVEPTADVAAILGIRPSKFMKLEGAACGLIVAPRRWHFRVQTDMAGQGWRQHQLDPCLYMK